MVNEVLMFGGGRGGAWDGFVLLDSVVYRSTAATPHPDVKPFHGVTPAGQGVYLAPVYVA